MLALVQCPECGRKGRAEPGQKVRCRCGVILRVSLPSPLPPSVPSVKPERRKRLPRWLACAAGVLVGVMVLGAVFLPARNPLPALDSKPAPVPHQAAPEPAPVIPAGPVMAWTGKAYDLIAMDSLDSTGLVGKWVEVKGEVMGAGRDGELKPIVHLRGAPVRPAKSKSVSVRGMAQSIQSGGYVPAVTCRFADMPAVTGVVRIQGIVASVQPEFKCVTLDQCRIVPVTP
jgi:hypothetical protein